MHLVTDKCLLLNQSVLSQLVYMQIMTQQVFFVGALLLSFLIEAFISSYRMCRRDARWTRLWRRYRSCSMCCRWWWCVLWIIFFHSTEQFAGHWADIFVFGTVDMRENSVGIADKCSLAETTATHWTQAATDTETWLIYYADIDVRPVWYMTNLKTVKHELCQPQVRTTWQQSAVMVIAYLDTCWPICPWQE